MATYYVTLSRMQKAVVRVEAGSHDEARHFVNDNPNDIKIIDGEVDRTWDIENSQTEEEYFA